MVHKDKYLDFLGGSVKEPTSRHVSRQNGLNQIGQKRPKNDKEKPGRFLSRVLRGA